MSRYSPHQNVVNYNAHGKQDRMLLGVCLMALGETFLVVMGAAIKLVGDGLPLIEVIFLRNLFAFMFLAPLVFRGGFSMMKTQHLPTHLLRALFGVLAMFLMFYAFASLKLTEAVLLKATSPIWLSLIAWLLLGERLLKLNWLAITLAFVGVVTIMQPGQLDIDLSLGFIAGISAAILAAIAKIMVRKLGRTDPSEVIVCYFAIFGTLFTLLPAVWVWQAVESGQWLILLSIAFLATVGQLCITKAFSVAKAGKVAMFSYLSMPIAALLGWFFLGEALTLVLALGSLIIVGAGVLNFYANRSPK